MHKRSLILLIVLVHCCIFCTKKNTVKSSDNVNPRQSQIDTLQTIGSFRQVGDYYTLTYSGDYSAVLEAVNESFLNNTERSESRNDPEFNCSLFSALGNQDQPLLGRNFDNPPCLVLLGRYNPPDGYASLAFTRMNDLGYGMDTDFGNMTDEELLPLLNAPFFPPDGINEHGLSVGLAYLRPLRYTPDRQKKSIFITFLVREMLDHAKTIEEAAAIARNHNVFDSGLTTISHHILLADAANHSIILEFAHGEWKTIPNIEPWQVLTNTPVFDVSLQQIKNACWRYRTAWDRLAQSNGLITTDSAMDILEAVSVSQGTQWSAVYNPHELSITFNVYMDYGSSHKFELNQ